MRQITTEGGGVYRLGLYTPEQMASLLSRADDGDADAEQMVRVVSKALRAITAFDAPDGAAAPLCLLCDTVFWKHELPEVIGIMHAARDDPSQAVVNGVCSSCRARHRTLEAIETAVLEKYRTMIPELRVLPPLGAPGRA